jgi:signal transduction histidine kinase
LAGGSALLTFVILASFAALVGVLTSNQVRGQFNDDVSRAGDQLQRELNHKLMFVGPNLNCDSTTVHLSDYAASEHAQIRIFDDGELLCTQSTLRSKGAKAPFNTSLFILPPSQGTGEFNQAGYRVAERKLGIAGGSEGILLYARPLSDVDHTLARVQFFLLLGVLGGTVLALLAGLATAQRAMRPIAQLTDAAREIERTRDPGLRLPHPEADDEIEELARTLDGMLRSLDTAHAEMESMLARQREFIADASHELRTPLTSVLANLELLAEELEGEQAESAQAALRSTRRMRRLVGDLLLLARADAKRIDTHHPMNLADVLLEAASELGPVADDHDLSIDAQPVIVSGARDDLHRLTLNLIENAVRHTPPGTHIRAGTTADNGEAILTVEDDGPGIPPELERRVFERFVRGGRDGSRGSGLGLAIVRAVAASHGGLVRLERPDSGGTRFVIRIPTGIREPAPGGSGGAPEPQVAASIPAAPTSRRRRRL